MQNIPNVTITERQNKIIEFVKQNWSINNSECQKIIGVSRETVTRDLRALVEFGILMQYGSAGRGARYKLK